MPRLHNERHLDPEDTHHNIDKLSKAPQSGQLLCSLFPEKIS